MSDQTTQTTDGNDHINATDREQPQIATTQEEIKTRASTFKMLDSIVVDDLRSFRTVGQALRRIKSEELWKEITSGWVKYCELRGGSSKRANRIIQAARADEVIRNTLQDLPDSEYPASEWQIRPLGPSLSDDEIVKSWKLALEAAENRKPKQKDVEAAVKQILGDDDDEKPEKKPAKKAEILALIARLHALIEQKEVNPNNVSFELIKQILGQIEALV